jgi:hypothetical protein
MYQEKDDQVTLTMARVEWDLLLVLLGIASGHCQPNFATLFPASLRLLNSLNEGNPRFIPYEIPVPEAWKQ